MGGAHTGRGLLAEEAEETQRLESRRPLVSGQRTQHCGRQSAWGRFRFSSVLTQRSRGLGSLPSAEERQGQHKEKHEHRKMKFQDT